MAVQKAAAGQTSYELSCSIKQLKQKTLKKMHLLTKPFWMRLPPTDCCPTHAIICEMLRGDPFDPHSAMILGLHGQQQQYHHNKEHYKNMTM